MIATFCNHFVGYHIFMLKCDLKQPSQNIDREHVLFPYTTGLNNRDNNVREKMKLLTRWGRDKMTPICISFPNTFFKRLKISLQFVPKGAVNYKSKLVQAMAWHREDWVIGDPRQWCIYESLGLIELITSPCWGDMSIRRKTVLFEHTRDTFTPITSGDFTGIGSAYRPDPTLGSGLTPDNNGTRYLCLFLTNRSPRKLEARGDSK